MIELDCSLLPAQLGAILGARGTELPPLLWHEHPNRGAKKILDAIAGDAELLGCERLCDEGMASAVRAMLYLWSGWPADSEMYAQLAPDAERAYVLALARRQAGERAATRKLLQEVAQHPIHDSLPGHTHAAIGSSPSRSLKRLREVIAFGGQWEPFAFADVFEQARNGQFDPAAEYIVRSIQCCEFELLLAYCIEAATGRKIEKRQPATPAVRRPHRRASGRPQSRAAPSSTKAEMAAAADSPPTGLTVSVLCPKCGRKNIVPEALRGMPTECEKCSTPFKVPLRRSAPTPASG